MSYSTSRKLLENYKAAALADVNIIRLDFLLEPLTELIRGVPRSSRHCPIANSIAHDSDNDVEVSSDSVRVNDLYRQGLSSLSSCFTRSFDAYPQQHYPELVAA